MVYIIEVVYRFFIDQKLLKRIGLTLWIALACQNELNIHVYKFVTSTLYKANCS